MLMLIVLLMLMVFGDDFSARCINFCMCVWFYRFIFYLDVCANMLDYFQI